MSNMGRLKQMLAGSIALILVLGMLPGAALAAEPEAVRGDLTAWEEILPAEDFSEEQDTGTIDEVDPGFSVFPDEVDPGFSVFPDEVDPGFSVFPDEEDPGVNAPVDSLEEPLADSSTVEVANLTALLQAISNAPTDGTPQTIVLTKEIDLRETLEVPEGKNIILDLNGQTLNAESYPKADYNTPEEQRYQSPVRVSGTLTFCDTVGTGLYKGSSAARGAVQVQTGGTFILDGGKIINDPRYPDRVHVNYGGGVHVQEGADFIMKDGVISCQLSGHDNKGGGVYNAGTFTMDGGAIQGCETAVNQATSGGQGGGVYNCESGIFIMNNGTIAECTADVWAGYGEGGGVYNAGTFTMAGGVIENCRQVGESSQERYYNFGGGGVYNEGEFTMTGGEIRGNTSTKNRGDGVSNDGVFVMRGGMISDNGKVGVSNGCGISLKKDNVGTFPGPGTFTMEEGTITGHEWYGVQNHAHTENRMVMTGGSIIKNRNNGIYSEANLLIAGGTIAENWGFGVSSNGSTVQADVTMRNGSIRENTEGGISIGYESVFRMEGGSIVGNGIPDPYGYDRIYGGVWLVNNGTMIQTGGAIYDNQASNSGDDLYAQKGCVLQLMPTPEEISLSKCGHPITGWFRDIGGTSDWTAVVNGKLCNGGTKANVIPVDVVNDLPVDSDGKLTEALNLKAAHDTEKYYAGTAYVFPKYGNEIIKLAPQPSEQPYGVVWNDGDETLTNYTVEFLFPQGRDTVIRGIDYYNQRERDFENEFTLYPKKEPVISALNGGEIIPYTIRYYVGETAYDEFPAAQASGISKVVVTWESFPAVDFGHKVQFDLGIGKDLTFDGIYVKNAYIGVRYYADQLKTAYNIPVQVQSRLLVRNRVDYQWVGESVPVGVMPPDTDFIEPNSPYTAKEQTGIPAGWSFDGWYTDEACTTKFVDGTTLSKDTTLYGRWTQEAVFVQFLPGEHGTLEGTDQYELEPGSTLSAIDGAAPAVTPADGWSFTDWLGNDNKHYTAEEIRQLPVLENMVFTAQYEEDNGGTTDPGEGGETTPPTYDYYRVTVNYLDRADGSEIAPSYKTASRIEGSRYDVSEYVGIAIDGYVYDAAEGDPVEGILNGNKTVNVYYTAEEPELPTEPTEPEIPTSPDEGVEIDNGETPTGDLPEESVEESDIDTGEIPTGDLPQTGTVADQVENRWTLGVLALMASMAAAGLSILISRKKEEQE